MKKTTLSILASAFLLAVSMPVLGASDADAATAAIATPMATTTAPVTVEKVVIKKHKKHHRKHKKAVQAY